LNNATSSDAIHKRIVAVLGEQMVNPIHQAFLEARREVDKGFDLISRGFTEFVLPDISLDEFMANMADWQTAQDNVDAMLAALGEHGLNSFASALMAGLDPEQLAYIAAVWGGDLRALYALLPNYAPGGLLHPGSSNPPAQYPPGEGPSPGGSSGGGGGTVNIGMIIGDDETVAESVSTALRRAKQRGG
jgi:hypothetical protein